ncbi:hypothetical protein BKI52_25215 [marine bacterium AO1-C]|nr:hypothetical protein BKI52_25215 [marine bacterium AO1-C]
MIKFAKLSAGKAFVIGSILCGILFFQTQAFAQFELMSKIDSIVREAIQDRSNPNYLKPVVALKANESLVANADPDTKSFYAQYQGFYNSFVTNYDSALYYFDKALMIEGRKKIVVKSLDSKQVKVPDAKNYILQRAKREQVIMINEAHHVGQHRAFAATLLAGLYQQGFRFLMVETLSHKDTLLNQRGYPLANSGYFTLEPMMSNLIRQAIKLGFKVLPYEANKRGTSRSKQQAMHLQEVLKKNPEAKMLVYGGIQNIEENHQKKSWVKMGEEFIKLTGINPFTIDQTEMTERFHKKYEHVYYRQVIKQGWLKNSPIVLEYQSKPWVADTGNLFVNYVDVQVFLPRTQLKNGRPTWLSWGTAKKYYKVDPKKWNIKQECLVQAFKPSDAENAVPIDQIHLKQLDKPSYLVLPKGSYQVKVWDVEKRLLMEKRVLVK